jgi:hypothetical protein
MEPEVSIHPPAFAGIAALDAALGALMTKVTEKELLAVTVPAMKNNEAVMKEMKRRESPLSPSV